MSRFALITGGSRGLGEHLVRRFWNAGYSLGVVARNKLELQNVLGDLPLRSDQRAIPMVYDLANTNEVAKLVDVIHATTPQLDVLVNNAAIQGPIGPLCDNNLDQWIQTVNINLIAPVYLCHGLIPMMNRISGSSIVNISGGGATGPRPNFSAYAAAKTGLIRFSETVAEEYGGSGVRVNCIAPGAMRTSMLMEVLEKSVAAGSKEAKVAGDVIMKGGASMDRVADLALFLAGDESKGISGKLISAVWDKWEDWPGHQADLSRSDVYTLRRIVGRDRGFEWGDK